ncbi:MAG: hypothetical protein R3314_10630 [Longimicrobiales bacterium]|nr:hypothetical protein [Longimicrobiales bacterium]
MRTLCLGALVLLMAASPLTASAQGVPDNIPDTPGESPGDRLKDRMIERHRGFLSRFFTDATVDVSPLSGYALGYQASLNAGLALNGGDAVFLSIATRTMPVQPDAEGLVAELGGPMGYVGAGYEVNGTRFLGETPTGLRTGFRFGAGVLVGELSALALDVTPTYHVLRRATWSVPIGVRVGAALFTGGGVSVVRSSLGLSLGVRWHWAERERLEHQ